jgi:hypothetical protein
MNFTWNHRVVRRYEHGDPYLEICEVYYDSDGAPSSFCKGRPVAGFAYGGDETDAEIVAELATTLARMTAALALPILDERAFPVDAYEPI